MDDFFTVNVNKSFKNLFDDSLDFLFINLADQINKTPIRAVLQDNSQESFLTVVKEFSCFEDVIML
jgi:hypothetical protein